MADIEGGTSAPATGRKRLFAELRDRIAASDPAYSRLRLAVRAMLSLGLSGGLLAALTLVRPLPIAAYGLAVVISFVGSMAVRDADGRGQALTRLFAGAAAVLSVFLASLLAPRPVIADLAFLAVIFGAVYIRKFGPRWFAVGMIAFMAYFMGDYLRPHPSDIGWLALAAALALIATHLSTAVLLRDDPERNFRRAVTTIDRRINLILRDLMQAAGDTATTRASNDPLRAHLARLHDVVLMAEGFIPQGEDGTLAAEGPASELAVALFDLQLAVEQLVRARRDARPPPPFLRAALAHDDRRLQQLCAEADRETDEAAKAGTRLLMRVHRARTQLDAMLAAAPCAAFSRSANAAPPAAQPAPPPAPSKPGIPVSLHRPIQVTLACAIALGCGILLSPVRWYWAVITAFIVFNNTSSRADTAVRALQRSAGTFGGLIAGTVVATVVQGQTAVSIAGILLLFFFAFYFIQVSYGLMIFLITIALALLYGLMGMFTPELLLVRLEETIVGGLAGAAVAFLVFPTRASTGVSTAFDSYLDGLGELAALARERANGRDGERDPLAISRTLDRSYAGLANAVRPLGGPWGAVTRFGRVRETLLVLAGCTHWARVLADSLGAPRTPRSAPPERIDALVAEVNERIEAAKAKGAAAFEQAAARDDAPVASRPRPVADEGQNVALPLEVIATLLGRL